jgi:FlaA1/EpsC-like NDP-sugar epimerase
MVITTVDPCVDSYNNPNITHYSEFFNKNVVSKINKKFDIIIARHVIEHVTDPVEFLKLCQSILTDNGVIYIEVPNLNDILSIERLTDFFNDHIQYFSNSSLSKAGANAGLVSVNSRLFLNNAHLGMVFKNSTFDILLRLDCAKLKVTSILEAIDSVDNFIIYGAGAHAVTFVSLLSTEQKNKILLVVDKDGNKSGKFLPGTQVPISTPTNFSTPLIVNTSVLYAAEVEKYLLEEQQFIGKILHL